MASKSKEVEAKVLTILKQANRQIQQVLKQYGVPYTPIQELLDDPKYPRLEDVLKEEVCGDCGEWAATVYMCGVCQKCLCTDCVRLCDQCDVAKTKHFCKRCVPSTWKELSHGFGLCLCVKHQSNSQTTQSR